MKNLAGVGERLYGRITPTSPTLRYQEHRRADRPLSVGRGGKESVRKGYPNTSKTERQADHSSDGTLGGSRDEKGSCRVSSDGRSSEGRSARMMQSQGTAPHHSPVALRSSPENQQEQNSGPPSNGRRDFERETVRTMLRLRGENHDLNRRITNHEREQATLEAQVKLLHQEKAADKRTCKTLRVENEDLRRQNEFLRSTLVTVTEIFGQMKETFPMLAPVLEPALPILGAALVEPRRNPPPPPASGAPRARRPEVRLFEQNTRSSSARQRRNPQYPREAQPPLRQHSEIQKFGTPTDEESSPPQTGSEELSRSDGCSRRSGEGARPDVVPKLSLGQVSCGAWHGGEGTQGDVYVAQADAEKKDAAGTK